MEFLDDPAAIHWSRLMISCTTQDASPNELINPEIWTNNHPTYTYSFTGTCLPSSLANKYSLIRQQTRAQTNTYILRYWWITIPNVHIVSLEFPCLLPLQTYIFLCLYSIALWSKFFEPCGIDHCASARTPELWSGNGALSNSLGSWNPSFSYARATSWSSLIFLIWIF